MAHWTDGSSVSGVVDDRGSITTAVAVRLAE